MPRKMRRLSAEEIKQAFASGKGAEYPVVLSVEKLKELLCLESAKTIYEWKAKGYFDDAYFKRGKHLFFWRDRVIDAIFNSPEWNN
jgi:hypothetical protein